MVLVWQPITDLPENWGPLTNGELGSLLQFWNDQRAELEQSGALAVFSQRLAREWSIETGQIEGVYNLDRGITQILIERGINADLIPSQPGQKPPELIAAIIQDHSDVLEGLFQFVRGERPLSKSYIHELHAALLKHQETTLSMDQFGNLFEAKLVKGRYKEQPNNPKRPDGNIHQYCPPNQVDSEMERLLAMHAEHVKQGVPVEVEAAWLHHRFTQIHPYQDGNGRVARALASLVFLKVGWFPVVVTRDERPRYIEALEVADEVDLLSFVSFLVHIQKRSVFEAMQTLVDTSQVQTVDDAIQAAKRVLELNAGSDPQIWSKAESISDRLMYLTERRMQEVAATLGKEIGQSRPGFRFPVYVGSDYDLPNLPYIPNTTDYDQGRVLSVATMMSDASLREEARIEIRAHAIGSKFRGLIGFAAVFRATHSGTKVAVSKEPFQVNYAESYESAEHRFRPWLEESLVNALTLWRKNL
jgi:Fic family protein